LTYRSRCVAGFDFEGNLAAGRDSAGRGDVLRLSLTEN